MVNGELHLPGAVHADARAGVGGKAAEEFSQPAEFHILFIYHTLLAQGDNLFAGGKYVALLIQRQDILADQFYIILPQLHKMSLDGVAGKGAGSHRDLNLFSLVGLKLHK
ncbi:hypothetical protein SDC9_157162 [bioreactor metagenome]|uniref:Uncharacterized protein n=1 Tax=bioreactor metagenome TaxID=1076179 RepID=A0A645F959_9ZZZZ